MLPRPAKPRRDLREKTMLRTLATVLLAACLAAPANGQQPLDLVPHDSALALVFRNPEELQSRGDRLLKDAGLKPPYRPSELFKLALNFLGVNAGVDTKRPAGAVVLDGANELTQNLVIFLPYTDLDVMAGNFGFARGEFKPERDYKARQGLPVGGSLFARDKYFFLAETPAPAARFIKGKKIAGELSAGDRKSMNQCDVLLQLGVPTWDKEWQWLRKDIEKHLGTLEDKDEKRVGHEFLATLGDLRYGMAGLRIEGGVGLNFLAQFHKEPKKSTRDFLKRLSAAPGGSHLRGLPEGDLLAAYAFQGDTSESSVVARVILDLSLKLWLQGQSAQEILWPAERPVLLGMFTEIWNRLKGSRVAVYRMPDESKRGFLSFLAILDTDDADAFIRDMKTLAGMTEGKLVDRNKQKAQGGVDPEQLIKDLGSASYRVRASATLRLRLLGEPALPFLARARKSSDLEIARRAQSLHEQIASAAARRRKDLLSKNPLKQFRPSFTFVAAAEKCAGHTVHIVRMNAPAKAGEATRHLEQLLGPEWSHVRLVPRGKQLLVLLGSEKDLLENALKNLDAGAPGLAAAKALKDFETHSTPERRLEFHLSLGTIFSLLHPEHRWAVPAGKSSLTSFALFVDAQSVRWDAWLPVDEFRAIGKSLGW
jgi:hypothetical protein